MSTCQLQEESTIKIINGKKTVSDWLTSGLGEKKHGRGWLNICHVCGLWSGGSTEKLSEVQVAQQAGGWKEGLAHQCVMARLGSCPRCGLRQAG